MPRGNIASNPPANSTAKGPKELSAPRIVMARMTKLKAHDRTFDLEFWQAHDSRARLNAAWEMVVHYHRRRNRPDHELRLQRSVARLQRKRR